MDMDSDMESDMDVETNMKMIPLVSAKEIVEFREPADMSILVTKATENLKELMTTVAECNKSYGDGEQVTIDQNMVDEIITTLKEVDTERLWLHESVEAETIKSSVLRHQLADFPRDTDLEIRKAIRAVRDSNHATIQYYKDSLEQSTEKQKVLKKKVEEYTTSNEELRLVQEEARAKYDSTLTILNETLLEKSTMQIRLNDTREKLKETQATTNEFQQSFVDLNEDMVTERKISTAEETRLKTHIRETVGKLDQQKKLNLEKKVKLDEVQQLQFISGANLAKVDEKIFEVEEINKKLQAEFDKLSVVLQEKMQESRDMMAQRDASKKALEELHEQFDQEKTKLESDIEDVITQLEVVRTEFQQLNKEKTLTEDKLREEELSEQQNLGDVEVSKKRLMVDKEELLQQSNECQRLKRQNAETQGAIMRVQQEHIAAAEILAKEIECLMESLEAEKVEKANLQERRDKIIAEASDYVNEFNAFAMLKSQNIDEGKAVYQTRTAEGRELQRKLKEAETMIKAKQKQLKNAKNFYIQMQKDMKGKIKRLKSSILKLEDDFESRSERADSTLPGFTELEETFQKRTEEFQQMKKLVVQMKVKKADLEASVEDKQTRLTNMETPKNDMVNEIAELRQSYLTQLEAEGTVTRSLENEIYETNQKLIAVQFQNDRFKKAIDFFESDIESMVARMKTMYDGKQDIDITTEQYRDWLEMQWRKHMELDKMYHDQDILLLDDIRHVEVMTSEREKKILCIHGQLEEHLDALSTFIENVADMRPKERNTVR